MEGNKQKNIFIRFLNFSTRDDYAIPKENAESNKPILNAFIND
jgi:hypothetical protein